MSVTPNRGLPLMEPSQSEPEVVFNGAMEVLDIAETLEVEHLGSSPGVRGVTKIKFSGASVTDLGGGAIEVTIDAVTGAGAGSLELTDGSTDLTGVTKIIVIGGTVGGTAGAATLAFSSGGGGGNVTPNSHPGSADVADDEFEGGALDTAGTRTAGATAWAWSNQGTSVATLAEGSLVLVPQGDGFSHFILQTAPATPWRYRLRAAAFAPLTTTGSVGGFVVYGSGSTKNYIFGQDASDGKLRVHRFTGPSTYDSSPYANLPFGMVPGVPVYLEVENDGTTLYFRVSATGVDGTFVTLFSQALATWVTAVTSIGVMGNSAIASAAIVIDWFRRMA